MERRRAKVMRVPGLVESKVSDRVVVDELKRTLDSIVYMHLPQFMARPKWLESCEVRHG